VSKHHPAVWIFLRKDNFLLRHYTQANFGPASRLEQKQKDAEHNDRQRSESHDLQHLVAFHVPTPPRLFAPPSPKGKDTQILR
jgi:hypothetical protein